MVFFELLDLYEDSSQFSISSRDNIVVDEWNGKITLKKSNFSLVAIWNEKEDLDRAGWGRNSSR